jgi:hypothetical protein
MTGSTIRQAAAPDEHQRGSRVVASQLVAQRSLADIASQEPISIQKVAPLVVSAAATSSPPQQISTAPSTGANLLAEGSFATGPEQIENVLRDELGLPPRRVGSAQARATSDSPQQSSTSLDLAWKVVFAAEQRKAALMERPVAFRSCRPVDKPPMQHDSLERPIAAHGSRAILPVPGTGGELQVSPIPARQLPRGGKPAGANSLQASADGDMQDREDVDRRGGTGLMANGKENTSVSRRRGHQASAGPGVGMAVSGQSLTRQRPPNSADALWPPDASTDTDTHFLVDAAHEHLACVVAETAAATELPEAQQQAELEWQAQCAAGPRHDTEFRYDEEESPLSPTLFGDGAGGSSWSGRRLLTSENDDPGTPAKTVDIWSGCQSIDETSHVAGQESLHAPAPAGAPQSDAATTRVVAGAEKSSASAAASARTTRRAMFASATRINCSPITGGVAASSAEPLSPQRPGASMRRSRSMPAPRKSADDCPKPKLARSSFNRRSATHGNSSMPKSTAAAAAGAGAVAAKKRAKASRKLMLPFAYAEDDPRVYHVECADGRVVPEYLP